MKKTNALRILDRKKIDYSLIEYTYDPENLDLSKIAVDNDLEIETVYKTLVLKGDKNGTFVAVVPGHRSLNLKTAAKISGNKKVAMFAVKDLEKTTGYIRGGCSPVGMKKAFPVFIDNLALELDRVYVNAGIRGILFGVSAKDLELVCNLKFGDISIPK